jgi:outer membrane lipoprotein-sorting protein
VTNGGYNEKKFKIVRISLSIIALIFLSGCTEADKVSMNVSQEADNFNVYRHLAVVNLRTDKPLFEVKGEVGSGDNQLETIAETENGKYRKHFVGLNEWTAYVIEDLNQSDVSKYRYEVNYQPESRVPFTITSKK